MGTLCTTATHSKALTSTSCGVRFERIPEEDDEINASLDESRSHLLVTAEWATQKTRDVETELVTEERPCRPRCIEFVVRELSRLNLAHASRSPLQLS